MMSDRDANPLTIRIVESIARVEAKVDSLMALDAAKALKITEQDTRISKLEHSRSYVYGASAALGLIASILFKVLFP